MNACKQVPLGSAGSADRSGPPSPQPSPRRGEGDDLSRETSFEGVRGLFPPLPVGERMPEGQVRGSGKRVPARRVRQSATRASP